MFNLFIGAVIKLFISSVFKASQAFMIDLYAYFPLLSELSPTLRLISSFEMFNKFTFFG